MQMQKVESSEVARARAQGSPRGPLSADILLSGYLGPEPYFHSDVGRNTVVSSLLSAIAQTLGQVNDFDSEPPLSLLCDRWVQRLPCIPPSTISIWAQMRQWTGVCLECWWQGQSVCTSCCPVTRGGKNRPRLHGSEDCRALAAEALEPMKVSIRQAE